MHVVEGPQSWLYSFPNYPSASRIFALISSMSRALRAGKGRFIPLSETIGLLIPLMVTTKLPFPGWWCIHTCQAKDCERTLGVARQPAQLLVPSVTPTILSIRRCEIRNTHLFFVDFYKSSTPHRLGDFVGSSLECASLFTGLDYHDGFATGSSLFRCGSFLGGCLGFFGRRFCHCFLCRLLSLGGCLFRCRRCGAWRTTRRSSGAYHYARQMLLQWKSVWKKRSSWLGVLKTGSFCSLQQTLRSNLQSAFAISVCSD